eukprot:9483959-Pyramimonas_sp.AAC.1
MLQSAKSFQKASLGTSAMSRVGGCVPVTYKSFNITALLYGSSCASNGKDAMRTTMNQAPESTVSHPCGSLSAGNIIRRIFGGIFEMPCAE